MGLIYIQASTCEAMEDHVVVLCVMAPRNEPWRPRYEDQFVFFAVCSV